MNVNIAADQVQSCHIRKINRQSSTSSDGTGAGSNQVFCVKFTYAVSKKTIMAKKRSRKNSLIASAVGKNYGNGPIYINDSLTASNRQLFNAAKKLKFDKSYKYLWFSSAAICMRKREGDSVVVIRSFGDLDEIV